VVFDGSAIIAGGIERVGLGTQTKSQNLFRAEAFRDEHGCFGEVECFPRAHADFLNDQLRELFHDLFANQRLVPGQKSAAVRV
jgi:hypothetical protein